MRITVLHNDDGCLARGRPEDRAAVAAVAHCARAVAEACRDNGWQPTLVTAVSQPEALVASVRQTRPDVVVNLVESLDGDARFEAAVAAVLELTGFAFTGSTAATLA